MTDGPSSQQQPQDLTQPSDSGGSEGETPQKCPGVVMLRGEAFGCEERAPHPGLGCTNRAGQLVWQGFAGVEGSS